MKELKRIAPLQAAKVASLVYLFFGVVMAAFMALTVLWAPQRGATEQPTWFIALVPLFYGALGFVLTLLMAGVYNFVAKRVGGFKFEVS